MTGSKLRCHHIHKAMPTALAQQHDVSLPASGNSSRSTTGTHGYYRDLISRRSQGGCPALLLAPMENLMDKSTRVSLLDSLNHARLGTFDEACTGEMQQRCAWATQRSGAQQGTQTAACIVRAQHRRQGCAACSLSHPAAVATAVCVVPLQQSSYECRPSRSTRAPQCGA